MFIRHSRVYFVLVSGGLLDQRFTRPTIKRWFVRPTNFTNCQLKQRVILRKITKIESPRIPSPRPRGPLQIPGTGLSRRNYHSAKSRKFSSPYASFPSVSHIARSRQVFIPLARNSLVQVEHVLEASFFLIRARSALSQARRVMSQRFLISNLKMILLLVFEQTEKSE